MECNLNLIKKSYTWRYKLHPTEISLVEGKAFPLQINLWSIMDKIWPIMEAMF